MLPGAFRWCVGLVAIALLSSGAAVAKPPTTTKYVYYTIAGNSASEIYTAMVSRGPRVGGVKAYATTTAVSSQSGRLLQGQTCRVEDYALSIDFTIKLPKLKNERALNGAAKSQWGSFSAFLKAHEEQHRAIWLGCRNDMQAKVAALRVKSCSELNSRTAKLWQQVSQTCNRKHEQLDARDQAKLLRHPFVKTVMAGPRKAARHALSVPVKKKKKRA
jgi:predicted secreted Zn-dependent protease